MKESTSMTREVINVELKQQEGVDILKFNVSDDDCEEGIIVNLNSEEGSKDLVLLFSVLLQHMQENRIELQLIVESGYEKGLYKDVAKEYIESLNREIDRVFETMKEELAYSSPLK